ncbi:putative protein phosphatase 2C 6 [Hibiscus syriacus]|uniref:PPM-type phosphatase domain-containing protein n=1 Tax=Hibiscus syriacus TaxID=106335 RepID=A0A6A2Y5Q6_HIBSY|nr:putative protein phosphatase 2C 6 [Hibiscus syriacus]
MEVSAPIAGPCVVSLGDVVRSNGCKLVAEKASLLSPSGTESDRGDNGVVSFDDSCISREYNHQRSEVEKISALQVNSERILSTSDVQDVKRVAVGCAGDDDSKFDISDKISSDSILELPQQKIRKTEIGRPEMEDAIVAIPRFLRVPNRMLKAESVANETHRGLNDLMARFYGVYNGHGGCQVANYCREHLHSALAEEIEIAKSCIQEGNVEHDWQEQWRKTFSNCFIKVDAETGGVRKVLYRGKQPVPLSVDHKPDREDEHARIDAAGEKVIQWNVSRVFGVLAMSRSIGDRYLKPWIIPDPEVMCVPRAKEDECLILASDGLWDVMRKLGKLLENESSFGIKNTGTNFPQKGGRS